MVTTQHNNVNAILIKQFDSKINKVFCLKIIKKLFEETTTKFTVIYVIKMIVFNFFDILVSLCKQIIANKDKTMLIHHHGLLLYGIQGQKDYFTVFQTILQQKNCFLEKVGLSL